MANGTFGGGTGLANDPWIVEDAADLNAIRNKPVSHYFKLKNNIDLDVTPYNSTGWTPIPSITGGLDGDGYVIKNLKIRNSALTKAGLFADMAGTIKDLGIVNVDITANEKVGALAGRIMTDYTAIDRCYSTGNIVGNSMIGGLVGEISELNNIYFRNCHSSATIAVTVDFAGGIIGYMTAPFTTGMNKLWYCYYNGTINGGNLVTATPLCGKPVNVDARDCFYDKEKTIQRSVLATGLTTEEMTDPKSFDNSTWRYSYRNNSPIWKFLDNCAPRLWFEDLGRFMIAYSGKYYVFNTATDTWTWVSDTLPDKATFWNQGMKDLESVPIVKFKELEQYGSVNIVNLVDSRTNGSDVNIKLQLMFDVTRKAKSLAVVSFTEKDIDSAIVEFNPVFRGISVIQDTKKVSDEVVMEILSQNEGAIDPNCLSDRTNQINKKSFLIDTDAKTPPATNAKSVTVGSAFQGTSEGLKSFINKARTVQVLSVKENEINACHINIVSQSEVAINSKALIDKSNHVKAKDSYIYYDKKKIRNDLAGNTLYEIYKTLVKRDRAIKVETKGEAQTRYLFSVNNGGKWLTYDSSNQNWVEADMSTINDTGITITQMADTSIWGSFPSDYRSKIKYAVGIRNENFNSIHQIQGFDIEFKPNNGPLIQDLQVQILDNKIAVSGALFDAENDAVEYQVVTKKFGETIWRQITPEQPGWYKRKNGYQFFHEYDLSNFRAGENLIKVSTRDGRGTVYELESTIVLVTGEPTLDLNSNNEFYMNARIDHTLGRKIRFRILVNGNQITPRTGYTDWMQAPFTFDYSWDSKDLLYGLPNEITIEVVDEVETKKEIKFHVVGGYRSLLFKDENNFYYSTDKGDILQQLDFGTVIGGLLSGPRIVFLENRTGLELENVEIWADNESQGEKVKLYISETLDPFVPVESISLPNTMTNGEIKPFYVRVESKIDVTSIQRKIFKIYAKGDPVVV